MFVFNLATKVNHCRVGQVADSSWLVLREQGALVEEADDDDDGGESDGDETYSEKDALTDGAVHDIVVGEDDGGGVKQKVDADGDPPFLR